MVVGGHGPIHGPILVERWHKALAALTVAATIAEEKFGIIDRIMNSPTLLYSAALGLMLWRLELFGVCHIRIPFVYFQFWQQSVAVLRMPSDALIRTAREFHPWDAMSPGALAGIIKRGPFCHSVETGCGGSTIVLSHVSQKHVAFAIEGADRTITSLRSHPDLRTEHVTFVEGETRQALPGYGFDEQLDLVLLDGPHAYPLPQVEFAYLFPWLKVGGSLVVDDIQIPSVYELFRFLRREATVELEDVVLRTAFFRRTASDPHRADGWESQGLNRRPILRYSWRDLIRKRLRSIQEP